MILRCSKLIWRFQNFHLCQFSFPQSIQKQSDFFSIVTKSFLRICSHLLKKSLIESFIFCAVQELQITFYFKFEICMWSSIIKKIKSFSKFHEAFRVCNNNEIMNSSLVEWLSCKHHLHVAIKSLFVNSIFASKIFLFLFILLKALTQLATIILFFSKFFILFLVINFKTSLPSDFW